MEQGEEGLLERAGIEGLRFEHLLQRKRALDFQGQQEATKAAAGNAQMERPAQPLIHQEHSAIGKEADLQDNIQPHGQDQTVVRKQNRTVLRPHSWQGQDPENKELLALPMRHPLRPKDPGQGQKNTHLLLGDLQGPERPLKHEILNRRLPQGHGRLLERPAQQMEGRDGRSRVQ